MHVITYMYNINIPVYGCSLEDTSTEWREISWA